MDDFVMPELDEGDIDPDAPLTVDEAGNVISDAPDFEEPEQMDRAAFWVVFSTAFDLPQYIMPDLQPLAIQPDEKVPARAASDAVYSLLEIYYPKALMPQGETFAHLMVAGPFFIAKAMVIKAVLDARNAPPPRQMQPSTGCPEQPKPDPAQAPERSDLVEWKTEGQPQ